MSDGFIELDLDPRLLRALGEMGLAQPTEVQEGVIPEAIMGRDILSHAPTGTGKTLAYLIPVMQRLMEDHGRKGGPHALVLVPTRELARQVFKEAQRLAAFTSLRIASIAGGEEYARQQQRLQHAPDLLIATPGRLQGWLAEGSLSLFDVALCVLDEADRMLDMGFGPEIRGLLGLMADGRQMLLFSATLEQQGIGDFAESFLNDPVLVEVGAARSLPSHIVQKAYLADSLEHKRALLQALLIEGQRVVVFTYSRLRSEQLADWLHQQGVECNPLHGEMVQKQRNHVLHRFDDGSVPVLVTTDLAARGLHVAQVARVIHFDLPRSAEIYVHRSGRSGRNGEEGESILLVEAHDARLLGRIERYQQQTIRRERLRGLEPRHKEPDLSRKKKSKAAKNSKETAEEKKRPKKRWRDMKNKGKPKGPLGKGTQSTPGKDA